MINSANATYFRGSSPSQISPSSADMFTGETEPNAMPRIIDDSSYEWNYFSRQILTPENESDPGSLSSWSSTESLSVTSNDSTLYMYSSEGEMSPIMFGSPSPNSDSSTSLQCVPNSPSHSPTLSTDSISNSFFSYSPSPPTPPAITISSSTSDLDIQTSLPYPPATFSPPLQSHSCIPASYLPTSSFPTNCVNISFIFTYRRTPAVPSNSLTAMTTFPSFSPSSSNQPNFPEYSGSSHHFSSNFLSDSPASNKHSLESSSSRTMQSYSSNNYHSDFEECLPSFTNISPNSPLYPPSLSESLKCPSAYSSQRPRHHYFKYSSKFPTQISTQLEYSSFSTNSPTGPSTTPTSTSYFTPSPKYLSESSYSPTMPNYSSHTKQSGSSVINPVLTDYSPISLIHSPSSHSTKPHSYSSKSPAFPSSSKKPNYANSKTSLISLISIPTYPGYSSSSDKSPIKSNDSLPTPSHSPEYSLACSYSPTKPNFFPNSSQSDSSEYIPTSRNHSPNNQLCSLSSTPYSTKSRNYTKKSPIYPSTSSAYSSRLPNYTNSKSSPTFPEFILPSSSNNSLVESKHSHTSPSYSSKSIGNSYSPSKPSYYSNSRQSCSAEHSCTFSNLPPTNLSYSPPSTSSYFQASPTDTPEGFNFPNSENSLISTTKQDYLSFTNSPSLTNHLSTYKKYSP